MLDQQRGPAAGAGTNDQRALTGIHVFLLKFRFLPHGSGVVPESSQLRSPDTGEAGEACSALGLLQWSRHPEEKAGKPGTGDRPRGRGGRGVSTG